MNFKEFIIESYVSDIKKTLAKLPKKHAIIFRGYKYKFEGGNELKGDSKHIGFIDEEKKTVTIAAPYNYGREFTFLHEVGHAVWKYLVDDKKQEQWAKIVKKTNLKKEDKQPVEELFCMAYGATYAKRPPADYAYDEWIKFVKNI